MLSKTIFALACIAAVSNAYDCTYWGCPNANYICEDGICYWKPQQTEKTEKEAEDEDCTHDIGKANSCIKDSECCDDDVTCVNGMCARLGSWQTKATEKEGKDGDCTHQEAVPNTCIKNSDCCGDGMYCYETMCVAGGPW